MGFSWSDLDPTNKSGAVGDFLSGGDNQWGWEDLAALGLAPVTGGGSTIANEKAGGWTAQAQDAVDQGWDQASGKDAAEAQAAGITAAADKDRAFNFPDVSNPLGSQGVSIDPVTGRVSLNQTLSPEQQTLVDALRGSFGTRSGDVEDALYGRATSRLDPQWGDRENQIRTRLYNQGLKEGDAAFDREMRNLDFARTDAYDAARSGATAMAGAEESRLVNAIMRASDPGLGRYWGQPNNVDAAVASGNIMAGVPTGYDAILGLLGIGAKAFGS